MIEKEGNKDIIIMPERKPEIKKERLKMPKIILKRKDRSEAVKISIIKIM